MARADKGGIQVKTFQIEWTIERFFADCENVGDYHTSPDLPISYPGNDSTLNLEIFPRGVDKANENYVSLFFFIVNESVSQMTVDYQCTIVSKGNNLRRQTKKEEYDGSLDNWGWPKFISENYVKDIANGALIDDTIKLLFEITIHPANQNYSENLYSEHLNRTANGLGDYEKYFESGSFADVTFNIQEHEIRLHKVVLSCRSSVFKAMFEHDMKENKQSTVDIEDIDFEVMKELFRFIYAGKVENIEKVAMDLLIAADKYGVIELQALCEKTLYDSVTTDNVVKYLKLADMCDTLYLKKLLISFAIDNIKNIVGDSDFYSVFAELNQKVLCEILKALASTV